MQKGKLSNCIIALRIYQFFFFPPDLPILEFSVDWTGISLSQISSEWVTALQVLVGSSTWQGMPAIIEWCVFVPSIGYFLDPVVNDGAFFTKKAWMQTLLLLSFWDWRIYSCTNNLSAVKHYKYFIGNSCCNYPTRNILYVYWNYRLTQKYPTRHRLISLPKITKNVLSKFLTVPLTMFDMDV
jgi:hypothetical protein